MANVPPRSVHDMEPTSCQRLKKHTGEKRTTEKQQPQTRDMSMEPWNRLSLVFSLACWNMPPESWCQLTCRNKETQYPLCNLFFNVLIIYFEREQEYRWGKGKERGRDNPMLSAQSLMQDSNPRTVRSWPESKARVRLQTDWATQVPIHSTI